jgi:hypothetical protein
MAVVPMFGKVLDQLLERAKQGRSMEASSGIEKSEYVSETRKTLVENYRYFVQIMQARLKDELAPKYFRENVLLLYGKDECKDQVVALTTDMFDCSCAFANVA